jgi:hypothetical protein
MPQLRDDAPIRLGAAYDIRDFRSTILDPDQMPLEVLDQVVEECGLRSTTSLTQPSINSCGPGSSRDHSHLQVSVV